MVKTGTLMYVINYISRVNVLKSTSSSYVQNTIENVVLTSYLDKS